MPNRRTVVPFAGTPEQEERLREAIERHRGGEDELMPILHEAQDIYGYVPEEVQSVIAKALDVPLTEVYGVATFYSRFALNPKGAHCVSVCLGTACYVRGAADVLAEVERRLGCKAGSITADGQFSVDATRCVGACGLGPIVLVDDDVYSHVAVDDVDDILSAYRKEEAR